jgi:hypothetical protein
MASKGNKKYALAILNSTDLSLGIHCNFYQTRDTIPFKYTEFVKTIHNIRLNQDLSIFSLSHQHGIKQVQTLQIYIYNIL